MGGKGSKEKEDATTGDTKNGMQQDQGQEEAVRNSTDGAVVCPQCFQDGQEFVRHYPDQDPVTCVMFFDPEQNVLYYNTSKVEGDEQEEEVFVGNVSAMKVSAPENIFGQNPERPKNVCCTISQKLSGESDVQNFYWEFDSATELKTALKGIQDLMRQIRANALERQQQEPTKESKYDSSSAQPVAEDNRQAPAEEEGAAEEDEDISAFGGSAGKEGGGSNEPTRNDDGLASGKLAADLPPRPQSHPPVSPMHRSLPPVPQSPPAVPVRSGGFSDARGDSRQPASAAIHRPPDDELLRENDRLRAMLRDADYENERLEKQHEARVLRMKHKINILVSMLTAAECDYNALAAKMPAVLVVPSDHKGDCGRETKKMVLKTKDLLKLENQTPLSSSAEVPVVGAYDTKESFNSQLVSDKRIGLRDETRDAKENVALKARVRILEAMCASLEADYAKLKVKVAPSTKVLA